MRRHVVVVGGGVTGLAAAHRLAAAGAAAPAVALVEATGRLGGRVRTATVAGRVVDTGPEALLTRPSWAVDEVERAGLGGDLVAPAPLPSLVFAAGALRPLPAGVLAGMPAGPAPLLRSRILSPAGVARAGFDLVLPQRRREQDESIGALVRRRLGDEMLERVIEPLLGGIHAGSCDALSVRAVAPQLAAASRHRGGLVRGLRAGAAQAPKPAPGAPPRPFMLGMRGGLARLAQALAAGLPEGVAVRTGAAVQTLARRDGRWELRLDGADAVRCDAVVLAVPAPVAARLLTAAAPVAAAELAPVVTASVAVVTAAVAPAGEARLPQATGFFVAPPERRTITAATFTTRKWPHLARAGEPGLLRLSVGSAGDQSALELGDADLATAALDDLRRITGVGLDVAEVQVTRHRGAFPQYEVGHLERLARLDAALADLPGLRLAGSSYRGAGVPACIHQGHEAADAVLAHLQDDDRPRAERAGLTLRGAVT